MNAILNCKGKDNGPCAQRGGGPMGVIVAIYYLRLQKNFLIIMSMLVHITFLSIVCFLLHCVKFSAYLDHFQQRCDMITIGAELQKYVNDQRNLRSCKFVWSRLIKSKHDFCLTNQAATMWHWYKRL